MRYREQIQPTIPVLWETQSVLTFKVFYLLLKVWNIFMKFIFVMLINLRNHILFWKYYLECEAYWLLSLQFVLKSCFERQNSNKLFSIQKVAKCLQLFTDIESKNCWLLWSAIVLCFSKYIVIWEVIWKWDIIYLFWLLFNLRINSLRMN